LLKEGVQMKLKTIVLYTVALSPLLLGYSARSVYGDEITTALMIGCLTGFVAGTIITLLGVETAENGYKETMLEEEKWLKNK